MADNARTTSLHKKLPEDLRKRIERDLIEQPPGRATYQEVYNFYALDTLDISFSALTRYGGFLRTIHRNQWIREFGDTLVGEEMSPKIESILRTRLYEKLTTTDDVEIDDLRRAAMAEKHLRQAKIIQEVEKRAAEEWVLKRQQMEAALDKLAAKKDGPGGLTPEAVAEIKSKVLGI